MDFLSFLQAKAPAFAPSARPEYLLPEEDCAPGSEEPAQGLPPPEATHYTLGTPLWGPYPEHTKTITFGFGCFWCSEGIFLELPGVYSTHVGYAGGVTKNPSYKMVCAGNTNHNEVMRLVYEPEKLQLDEILKLFWESHDPTTYCQQGGDRGHQYRSGIYYYDDEQRRLAEASKAAYEAALKAAGVLATDGEISTEILPAPTFYMAEEYHQQYDAKPGSRNYCGLRPTGVSCPPMEEWNVGAGAEASADAPVEASSGAAATTAPAETAKAPAQGAGNPAVAAAGTEATA